MEDSTTETRTLRYWLARQLLELRAGRPRADVIAYMRVRGQNIAESTIARFEGDDPKKKKTEGFAENMDVIVAGYAGQWGNGLTPREVWLRAWVSWSEKGGTPAMKGEITPDARAALAAIEEHDRDLARRLRSLGVAGLSEAPNTSDEDEGRRQSR